MDDPDYTPQELAAIFDSYMDVNSLSSFTVRSINQGSEKPVGMIIVWARGRVLQVSDMVWFPWASQRNIFEGALKFFDQLRRMEHEPSGKNYIVLEYSMEKDKKYFEKMMNMGLIKRCGKIEGLYEDQDSILYYTNEVKNAI